MKTKLLILIVITMGLFACSKNIVYNIDSNSQEVEREESNILFDSTGASNLSQMEAGGFIALLPDLVNLGFKITDTVLQNNIKKYASEYLIQKSYTGVEQKIIPSFTFQKKIKLKGIDQPVTALEIKFKAKDVIANKIMIYYIEQITLNHSKAKVKKGNDRLDYLIELKPTLITGGKKEALQIAPIAINSVHFGTQKFDGTINADNFNSDRERYRTDLLIIPAQSLLSEINLKIVETNPFKVKLENILGTVNNFKDDAKTIINNIIGGKDSSGTQSSQGAGGQGAGGQGTGGQGQPPKL